MFFFNTEIFLISIYNFISLIYKIIIPLTLVFVLLILTNCFIDNKKLVKLFEKRKLGWTVAIVSGIISSGPIYLWYPLLSELKEKGIKYKYIACFLYNRSIKIPLLPVFVYYFGWKFVLVLFGYTVIFSILLGVLVEKFCE